MSTNSSRIFTRNFILLFAINILVVIGYVMLFTTMARYAVLSYAASDSIAGLTSASFLIASMFARMACGCYGEALGLKRVTIAACALMVVSCAMYLACENNFALLLAMRITHGISFGIANTTVPALVAKALPSEAAGAGTGIFMLSNTVGTAIGPWLGIMLANAGYYVVMFFVSTGCAVVAMLLSLIIDNDRASESGSQARISEVFAKRVSVSSFIDPGTFKFGLFIFASGCAYSGITAFLNGYSVEIGLADAAPYSFVLYAVTLLASRPLAGKIMDTRGENTVVIPCLSLMAIGFVILVFAQNPPGMISVGALMAIGFGSALSIGAGIIARDSHDERTTLRVSTLYLMCDAGIGTGPFFLGLAITYLGYEAMYLICGVITLVSVVLYYVFHGKNAKRRAQS